MSEREIRLAPVEDREVLLSKISVDQAEGRLPKLPEAAQNDERFVYRYIRVAIAGEVDVENIQKREREGWRFVTPKDVPDGHLLPALIGGPLNGKVGLGDLAMARLPREIAEARMKMIAQRSKEQVAAVNSQLLREHDPRMPIFNESRTAVRVGRNAEFDPN